MTDKLVENEHVLSTPRLIGTDPEKVTGIKFWADVIALIRSINTTFVSYNNKKAVIAAFKAELDLVEAELDNLTATVNQGETEIPSAEQSPEAENAGDVNVVDLTKNNEVSATTVGSTPSVGLTPPLAGTSVRPPPTFENLDKLRRVAGSGVWDKNHGPIFRDKKK